MLYYFDSSAVIKRYAQETGTAWIKQFFVSSNNNQVYFSQVTSVEVASGLSRKVRTHELSQPILTFVCADSRLLDIARQENLAIENPNLY